MTNEGLFVITDPPWGPLKQRRGVGAGGREGGRAGGWTAAHTYVIASVHVFICSNVERNMRSNSISGAHYFGGPALRLRVCNWVGGGGDFTRARAPLLLLAAGWLGPRRPEA